MLKVCESCGRATRRVRAKYPGCLRCGAASWESAESILGNRLIVLWFGPDRRWYSVPTEHWPLAIVRAALLPDFDGEWTETRLAGDLFAYQSAADKGGDIELPPRESLGCLACGCQPIDECGLCESCREYAAEYAEN